MLSLAALAPVAFHALGLYVRRLVRQRVSTVEKELPSRLADGTIRLVRVDYLLKLDDAAILPRRQDLPESAFLSHEQVQQLPRGLSVASGRGLRILVVSHAWLQPDHPDPRGETLQLLARVLTEYAKGWGKEKGGRYGVFLDFCSLFQKGRDGEERR